MIEQPNPEEMLRELSDIECRLEKLANLPPAQSVLPVTAHRLPDIDVLNNLDHALNCVRNARRRLRGINPPT